MFQRMTRALLLTAWLSGLACSTFAASVLIHSEANWAAHLDLDKLKETELGKFVLARIEKEPYRQKLDALQAVLRFDPRQQLQSITAFGQGKKQDDGVVILRGEFDPAHLISIVKANDAYTSLSHGDRTIHSWIDDKDRRAAEGTDRTPKRSYGSFLSKNILLIGKDRESLSRAIDVLSGGSQGVEFSKWLAPSMQSPATAFAAAGARVQELADIHPNAALLKNAQAARLHLGESNGFLRAFLHLEGENPSVAEALKKIAEGMATLWQMKEDGRPIEVELARSIQVQQKDSIVTISGRLSGESVKQKIEHTLSK